jgi:hypothetical protein
MSGPEPTPSRPTPTPVSKVAYALLGLMTLVSFGGPFGIALLLRGASWPSSPSASSPA